MTQEQETDPYVIALEEIEKDQKLPALWSRALVKSEGNFEKAKSYYIKLRVADLANGKSQVLEYFKNHFYGKLSLVRAFWINHLGLGLLIFIELELRDLIFDDYMAGAIQTLIFTSLLLIFILSIIGVGKTAWKYMKKKNGNKFIGWGAIIFSNPILIYAVILIPWIFGYKEIYF